MHCANKVSEPPEGNVLSVSASHQVDLVFAQRTLVRLAELGGVPELSPEDRFIVNGGEESPVDNEEE
jgi:hypothetical protein